MNYQSVKRRKFIKQLAGVGLAGTGLTLDSQAGNLTRLPRGSDLGPICVFSKHLQFMDFAEMADTAAEIGFQGVDLTVRPGGHILPENVERDLPRAVEEVRRVGLQVPMMTTAIRRASDPLTGPILETASGLGIGHYRLGYYHYDPELGVLGSLEGIKVELSQLADLHQSLRIVGNYQNHAGPYVGAPIWDLHLLMKDLDPNWIGCQYDIRHATVEGGRSWAIGLELLKDYVHTLVIKDFKWGNSEGKWQEINLPVGQGMVDFSSYLTKLKELGIGGAISMHFEYPVDFHIGVSIDAKSQKEKVMKAMKADLRKLQEYILQSKLPQE